MYPPFWTVWHEASTRKYPVFYLLHGAMDTDDAWTFVDRAGFILDNLLADGKIKPMIVVMPAGHQPGQTGMPGMGAAPPAPGAPPAVNPFTAKFMTDIMPYVEKTTGRSTTDSIAPLRASQWAAPRPSISFLHLDQFSTVGVFSSSAVLGRGRRGPAPAPGTQASAAPAPTPQEEWETAHQSDLDNASLKKGLKLIWMSTGVDDGLMASTKTTVEILKKHGFEPVFIESPGAHSWFNWRNYLIEFSPQLF